MVVEMNDLATAKHLILLGAAIEPGAFPASANDTRQQLTAWTDEEINLNRKCVLTLASMLT